MQTLVLQKNFSLNGNTLKVFACFCMLLDHIGMIFFPNIALFRAIGRLALPIFAFFVAEGCKYTHDKTHYLVFMALLGVAMMFVQFAVSGIVFGNVLVLFALSIILIYSFNRYKKEIFADKFNLKKQILYGCWFWAMFVFCGVSCKILSVDYGFYGVILPFFVSIPDFKGIDAGELKRFDDLHTRLLFLGIALILLTIAGSYAEILGLVALVPLMFYNGQRGDRKLKYAFYVFYPTHLALLYGIALLL